MHDLGAFRANLDAVAARLATRGLTLPLDEIREQDSRRRLAITESEQLQAEKNRQSKEIGQLRKAGADTTELEAQSRAANERIAELKAVVDDVDTQFRTMLAGIPNVPHESVPVGRSAEDNVVLRTHGMPGSAPPRISAPSATIWKVVFHLASRETGIETCSPPRNSRRPDTAISRIRMTSPAITCMSPT